MLAPSRTRCDPQWPHSARIRRRTAGNLAPSTPSRRTISRFHQQALRFGRQPRCREQDAEGDDQLDAASRATNETCGPQLCALLVCRGSDSGRRTALPAPTKLTSKSVSARKFQFGQHRILAEKIGEVLSSTLL